MRRITSSTPGHAWVRWRSSGWSGRRWCSTCGVATPWTPPPSPAPRFERGTSCSADRQLEAAAPEFQRDFTYLTLDAARLLVEREARAVGMDYLSIEQFGSSAFPVHHELLGAASS